MNDASVACPGCGTLAEVDRYSLTVLCRTCHTNYTASDGAAALEALRHTEEQPTGVQIKIAAANGRVHVMFPTFVRGCALGPDEAEIFGKALLTRAAEARATQEQADRPT